MINFLTPEFPVDHDVQVLLWVSTDVSGDGVQPDGGILQTETHPRTVEPGQTTEEKQKHTNLPVAGLVVLQSPGVQGSHTSCKVHLKACLALLDCLKVALFLVSFHESSGVVLEQKTPSVLC